MKIYIILIASIITVLLASCENKETEKQLPADIQKLDSLKSLCLMATNLQIITPAQELAKEAINMDNDSYIATAYYYMCKYYSSYYELESVDKKAIADSIRIYGQKAKDYFQKVDNPAGTMHVEQVLLSWEVTYGNSREPLIRRLLDQIEKAKQTENKEIISGIYFLLGYTYSRLNCNKEALEAYQSYLEVVTQMEDNPDNPLYKQQSHIIGFMTLAEAAGLMQDADLALAYSDSIRYYTQSFPDESIVSYASVAADIFTLDAYIRKEDWKQAKPMVDRLEAFCNKTDSENKQSNYYDTKTTLAEYYFCTKRYTKALQSIDEVLHYNTVSNNKANLNIAKKLKADILAGIGYFEEAYRLEYQVQAHTDSLLQENSTRQLSEMQTTYNVSHLEKQNLEKQLKIEEEKVKKQRWILTTIALTLVCVSLVIIFIIIGIKNKNIRKKNQILFDQYKLRINNLQKGYKKEEEQNQESPKESSLYDKLEECLSENRLFEDSDITREALAAELGTNREYLIRAIQENTGMTFNEYINNHRLEYAGELLYKNTDSTIKNIYLSAGFNNERTFYRVFKQKYGMSPKEFQNIAIQEIDKKQ